MTLAKTRLVEVPEGWENGGNFVSRFDGISLHVDFGDEPPCRQFNFSWVRSFRYVSEATYNNERDGLDVHDALLSEIAIPHADNPSDDHYGVGEGYGKDPPRLFRLFHYKAGFFDIVASHWNLE